MAVGCGSGSRDTGVVMETQLIKRFRLRLRSRTRPNPPELLFHLRYHRVWQLCALGNSVR